MTTRHERKSKSLGIHRLTHFNRLLPVIQTESLTVEWSPSCRKRTFAPHRFHASITSDKVAYRQ